MIRGGVVSNINVLCDENDNNDVAKQVVWEAGEQVVASRPGAPQRQVHQAQTTQNIFVDESLYSNINVAALESPQVNALSLFRSISVYVSSAYLFPLRPRLCTMIRRVHSSALR